MQVDFGGGDEIRFEEIEKAGVITLTRPKALNAINHRMVGALTRALAAWEKNPAIHLVLVKGEGRAFSAGGDIMDVYEAGKAGMPNTDFFADEYRLNAAIARFPKPYVALIDGIVMGGGVGISFHGSHRVMSENAVFAMPETGIGFFPDVGGSHLLSRLEDAFGMYLALTGNRIRRGDALWARLATHAVDAAHFDEVAGELARTGDADAVLQRFAVEAARELDDEAVRTIERCFSRETLEDVLSALEEASRQGDAFARSTRETLATRSPTSLHVTFRQIRIGGRLSMDDCMRMEFRILHRMLAGQDFYEGIRAAIVEKGSTPRWRPASLEKINPADIDAYFAPLEGGELDL